VRTWPLRERRPRTSAEAPPRTRTAGVAQQTPTGGLLGGFNDCTWELRPTGGTPSTERRECWKTFGVEASTSGTVCVSARGKTGCAEYKQ